MLFITGTDTGVGKTVIARAIIRAGIKRGLNIGVMKPVETGCIEENGVLVPLDAKSLKESAGVKHPLDFINPYRFALPVSPHIAAKASGNAIVVEVILNCFNKIKKDVDFCIVEGAGGVMVPLSPGFLTIDLIKLMNLEVLVVAKDKLGTINHTLLTLEALRNRGIKIKGVVLNRITQDLGVDSLTNADSIREYGKVDVIGIFPYIPTEDKSIGDRILSEIAEQYLDVNKIFG